MTRSAKKRTPRAKQAPTVPSRDARRVAAAILEVLAGLRTPTEAAQAISISVPRYYQIEQRALEGLVASCEPRARGYAKGPEQRVAELEKEVERLKRDCDRHQALARASQRTIGLALPAPAKQASAKKGSKRRKRRPTVRALKAARNLRPAEDEKPDSALKQEEGHGGPHRTETVRSANR